MPNIEQSVINANGLQKNGGTLLNKINSISSTRTNNSISSGSGMRATLSALYSALTALSKALSNFTRK